MVATALITIGGADLPAEVMRRLIAISVTLPAEGGASEASFTMDATGAKTPGRGAAVSIALGVGAGLSEVFRGTVDDVAVTGSRAGGETFRVTCRGFDTLGGAKTTRRKNFDGQTCGAILEYLAGAAGLTPRCAPEVVDKVIEYFAMIDESVLQAGSRLADLVGGHFRIDGENAVIASKTAQYAALAVAARGVNLIEWDVSPIAARNRFGKIVGQWYDRAAGVIKRVEVKTELDSDAEYVIAPPAATEADAKQKAEAMAAKCARDSSSGRVTINGALVVPDGRLQITGTIGADGTYRAVGVSHSWSRQGWTTSVQIGLAE